MGTFTRGAVLQHPALRGSSLPGTIPGAKVGTYLASLSTLSGLFCACALIPAKHERTVLRPASLFCLRGLRLPPLPAASGLFLRGICVQASRALRLYPSPSVAREPSPRPT